MNLYDLTKNGIRPMTPVNDLILMKKLAKNENIAHVVICSSMAPKPAFIPKECEYYEMVYEIYGSPKHNAEKFAIHTLPVFETSFKNIGLYHLISVDPSVPEENIPFIAEAFAPFVAKYPNVIVPLEFIEHTAPPFVDGYVRTYSGHYLNVLNPDPQRINLIDIGRGLSRQYRYNGQCDSDITVMDHSLWMYYEGKRRGYPKHVLKQLLFHDAVEGYFGDIPKPMKNFIPQFSEMEDNWMKIVGGRFGFEWPMYPEVKELDAFAIYGYEWDKYVLDDQHNITLITSYIPWFKALSELFTLNDLYRLCGPLIKTRPDIEQDLIKAYHVINKTSNEIV